MAQVTIKNIDSVSEWEGVLGLHSESNFLQSWDWGEFQLAIANKIHRVGFFRKDICVGVALAVVENAKRGRYLTVPGGPLIDWKDTELVDAFTHTTRTIAGNDSCVFVRVRPQLISDDFSKGIFAKQGFVAAPMHMHAELTSQLSLSPSEDELIAHMRKTTRYEIKKAEKLGIQVSETDNPTAVKDFYNLQIETSKRQHFVPFSYTFLYEQFSTFAKRNKALLYTATVDNKLLSQAFIIFDGQEAVYHYGASTQLGRSYPGAYLVQWEAICEAKRRGLARYNFWGVAPEDQKNHRFYGVSVFKRGFGGTDVEYLHAQDLIFNRPRYLINTVIEKMRKTTRGL